MDKQVQVYYSGQVQGVGFRYAARDIARSLGVRGWVKNLTDGRVEVVAEAGEDALDGFLEEIHLQFSRYIQNQDVQRLASKGNFTDFEIRF